MYVLGRNQKMCRFNHNGELLLLLLLLLFHKCSCTPSSGPAAVARIHELLSRFNHTPPFDRAWDAEATLTQHQDLADRRSEDAALRAAPILASLPAASGSGLTIVTAADHTHKCPLLNLIRSVHTSNPGTRVLVYDIGVRGTHPDLDLSSLPTAAGGSSGVVLRRFPYANYPRFFLANESAGEYAWKPAIIKLAADEFGHVLWLDAGNEVHRELSRAAELIRNVGFFSPTSRGAFLHYTHPEMRKHFGLAQRAHAHWKSCNAAIVGMSRDSDAYEKVLIPWHACAMNRSCIAPPGSSRRNHRQDQAALTCIIHLSQHFHCKGACRSKGHCLNGRVSVQTDNDGRHDPDTGGRCPSVNSPPAAAAAGSTAHVATLPTAVDTGRIRAPAQHGAAVSASGSGLTIVTAADHTHKCPLRNLIRSVHKSNPGMRVLVYDIGVRGTHPDLDLGSLSTAAGSSSGVVLRRFPYANYPRFFLVNESAGEYAWKPAIIKLAADEFGHVLWLDAGNEVHRELSRAAELLRTVGFFSPASGGGFGRWTHQGMRTHFNISASGRTQIWNNCNAAIVGISRDSDAYGKVLIPWHACAMNRSCIAPPGSSRRNHRQDQAALTCITHLSQHFHCQGMCSNRKPCRYGIQLRTDQSGNQRRYALGSNDECPPQQQG